MLWSAEVAPWREGYSITSAPLYYEGLVISGATGAYRRHFQQIQHDI